MSNQGFPTLNRACCVPVTAGALSGADAATISAAFKALGDPVRLQLFSMIASAADEVCVCDLTCAFDLTAPTISHHLKTLRTAGLVESERRGTWVYYRSVPGVAGALSRLLAAEVPA